MAKPPAPPTATDEEVRALLERYRCPVPFHEVPRAFSATSRRRLCRLPRSGPWRACGVANCRTLGRSTRRTSIRRCDAPHRSIQRAEPHHDDCPSLKSGAAASPRQNDRARSVHLSGFAIVCPGLNGELVAVVPHPCETCVVRRSQSLRPNLTLIPMRFVRERSICDNKRAWLSLWRTAR